MISAALSVLALLAITFVPIAYLDWRDHQREANRRNQGAPE